MLRILKFLIIVVIAIIFAFVIVIKTPLAKYPVSLLFSNALKSDISIKRCSFSFTKGIKASDMEIKNEKGLHCIIKDAFIKCNFLGLIKNELFLDYSLKTVKFSYPDSEVINGIAGLFAIEPTYLLQFNTVDGAVYIKPNEIIVKDLNAVGAAISLFANGTTTDNKFINYQFRLTLSKNITSRIPEAIQKVFFKEQEEYSVAELYLKGSIKKPSISFSTPLFKLLIKLAINVLYVN